MIVNHQIGTVAECNNTSLVEITDLGSLELIF
jgi:hypothetical protein